MGRTLSPNAQNVNWLLANFTDNDVFVEQTIAVSSDGLLMAASSSVDRSAADRLAAVVSGMRSLAEGGARVMGKGSVNQVIVEMDHGYLFVTSISDGSVLGVLTSRDADLAAVGYETTLLVDRVGALLTPAIVAELKQMLASDPLFAPARPVMKNPTRSAVTDPAALAVFDLFADAYDAVILLLMRYFGQTDESAPEVLGLQQAVFFPMMTAVVRPLGEVLMQLPAGTEAGVRAGPSFAFGRRLAFLPHREAAWSLIGQHLASMADTAMSVAAAGGFPAPITARLQFVAENLARISLNFAQSMLAPGGES